MNDREMRNKPLSDGEMDAVVGGTEQTYRKVQVWGTLCEHYQCRYCGSENRYYTNHKSKRCPVPGYGNPNYDPNDIVSVISAKRITAAGRAGMPDTAARHHTTATMYGAHTKNNKNKV